MNTNLLKKHFSLILLTLCYLFFAFYDGVILSVDSPSYIDMYSSREPLYSLLIAFFRLICFNNSYYLNVLVIFQSLLTAFCVYSLIKFIVEEYELSFKSEAILLLIHFGVIVLMRFVSKKGMLYSNTVLSESITYPLYLLFFRYNLEYVLKGNKKPLIVASIISFIMISARKQMFLSLFMLIISIVYVSFKNKNLIKGLFKVVAISCLIVGLSKGLDFLNQKVINNFDSTHTLDNRFITTMIYYVGEDDDYKHINNQDSKEVFNIIYNSSKSNGYTYDENIESWFARVKHFSSNYDNIQIDTIIPETKKYVEKKYGLKDALLEQKMDDINNNIIKDLLPIKCLQIAKVVFDSFLAGLMITISADNSIFVIYAIFAYLVYFVLLVYSLKKNGLDKYSVLGILVILSIFINVGIVSAVIFNQTRYTIYNFDLFYIGLYLLFLSLIKEKGIIK